MDRLFVYGSLQPGGANEHILEPLNGQWQAGTVRGRLVDEGWGARLGFPGLQLDDCAPEVPGYLFTAASLSNNWDMLDDFEGAEYQRCDCEVTLSGGRKVVAQIYALRDN